MILDSSAFIAIARREAGFEGFLEVMERADTRRMSAATWLETTMVFVANKGSEAAAELEVLRAAALVDIIPFSADHATIAREAFMKYGKGRNHPAALNFGDCISYATAKLEMMPLLFKGDDFRLTDIEPAI